MPLIPFRHLPLRPCLAWLATLVMLLGCGAARAEAQAVDVSTFKPSGLGVDWCAATNQVAYDIQAATGFYQVRLCNPDGSNDRALSPGITGLPTRTVASPGWYPDGSWMVVSVEKPVHPGSASSATPGFGGYTDLWAIAADGSWCTQLTNVPNDANHGTIGGHCSRDGRHLIWTEMVQGVNIFSPQLIFGAWVVKVADITLVGGRPQLGNIRIINPGGQPCFNEGYGFSPDSTHLLFASSWNQASVWSLQIFVSDLNGGGLAQLTTANYNEHAVYKPDGSAIVWMSNAQSTLGGTDWWMMDPDGSNPRRLTTFNEPSSPQSSGAAVWAGLITFSPDGASFLGGVERSLVTVNAFIDQVQLLPSGTGTGLHGAYFTHTDLESDGAHDGATVSRLDATVNFNWGLGSPAPAIPAGSYSARWTGTVQPYRSGACTFTVTADDGARLWVDGTLVIDAWTMHAATAASGTITLQAGHQYPIRLEYYNGFALGSCVLSWSDAQQMTTVIPATQLYPDSGTTSVVGLTSGARARSYRLHLPPQASTQSCPVLLALHGAGGTGVQVEEDYNLDALADEEGVILAYPDGVDLGSGEAWSSGFGGDAWTNAGIDDVAFIGAVLDDITARTHVDASRIYACGLSSGAMMCSRLASALSSRIAAVVNVNGPFTPAELALFHPARPVSGLLIAQTGDIITPYAGESLAGITILPASQTIAAFTAGALGNAQTSDYPNASMGDGTLAHLAVYGPGASGAEVDAIRIDQGGHTWPGSIASGYGGWLGLTCFDIDAASISWKFLRRHQLGGQTLAAPAQDSLAVPAPLGTYRAAAVASASAGADSDSGSAPSSSSSAAGGCGLGSGAALLGCLAWFWLRQGRGPRQEEGLRQDH